MNTQHSYNRASSLGDASLYKSEFLAQTFSTGALAAPPVAAPGSALDVIPVGHNILGVGYGSKVTTGAAVQGQIAVRVYVRSKLAKSSLTESEIVPSDINGTPTDVIAVGDVTAFERPVSSGVSVGHFRITAGTLGCLVVKTASPGGPRFILSNNHILANANDANIGDPILEPGPLDGGDPADPIANLTDFLTIDFSGPNAIDCAIAELIRPGDVTPDILNIGRIVNPPMTASLHQSVRKQGRTTQHTIGIIADLSADIRVRYGTKVASFEEQIAVTGAGGLFSDGGDSGALIVDAVTLQPVALLFAGGLSTTFANPITPVLAQFGVTIL